MSTENPYAPQPAVEAARIVTPSAGPEVEPAEVADFVAEKTHEEAETAAETFVPEAAPEGSIADILDWVGEDSVRATTALAAEEAGSNRKTLINKLKALV